jgi:hypothetical protein
MGSFGTVWDNALSRAEARRTVDLRGKPMRFLFRHSLQAMILAIPVLERRGHA